MFGKKSREILLLKERIRFLEDKICPGESHDWVLTGHSFVPCSNGWDTETIRIYTCRKCRKRIQKYDWEG